MATGLKAIQDIDTNGVNLEALYKQVEESYPDEAQLEREARKFMKGFTKEVKSRKRGAEQMRGQVDSDGWQTVVGRHADGFYSSQVNTPQTNVFMKERMKKRIKEQQNRVDPDLYGFQVAALKAQRADILFAREKGRKRSITKLAANRRFVPS
eukprot:NODE_11307_length_554_cov_59.974478_g10445_i1.p1 GENE.NODE_11307_length_554_cov_59.974478_g10445_i1~~NODE_11307_length_554_cov_59.974478_g10445_i1.p1  ORF type:complete len:174 (-),score=43.81 NODE_11307_length_554_cov_59.974478_g10445_i1:33-491(-)